MEAGETLLPASLFLPFQPPVIWHIIGFIAVISMMRFYHLTRCRLYLCYFHDENVSIWHLVGYKAIISGLSFPWCDFIFSTWYHLVALIVITFIASVYFKAIYISVQVCTYVHICNSYTYMYVYLRLCESERGRERETDKYRQKFINPHWQTLT